MPLSALIVVAALAAPAPWAVTETHHGPGWAFTPSFSADGETAWFVHWADPLNLDAPQRLYETQRTREGWSPPQEIPVAPGALLDWPAPGRTPGEVLLTVARTSAINGARVYDFDLFAFDISAPAGSLAPLASPDLNRSKTARTATLGVAANEFGPWLSGDGTLWFWSQRPEASGWRDIFFAPPDPDGDAWLEPREFPLNTAGRDSHPWVSPDGSVIVFTSDRPGGHGGDDLWMSARTADGAWGDPVNLGPAINSSFDDEAARLTPDGRTLFFTSNRPMADRTERYEGSPPYRVYSTATPQAVLDALP